MIQSVSTRCRPRKMVFTTDVIFYVQRFVMWSSGSVRRLAGFAPRRTPHNGVSLQPLQPADHVPVFVEDLSQPVVSINWRRASCQCLSCHFQIDLYVRVCCSKLNMAQPSLNDGEIHAGLEQVHGGRMSKTVGAYAPPRVPRLVAICEKC
jgi:hypothetical protein